MPKRFGARYPLMGKIVVIDTGGRKVRERKVRKVKSCPFHDLKLSTHHMELKIHSLYQVIDMKTKGLFDMI